MFGRAWCNIGEGFTHLVDSHLESGWLRSVEQWHELQCFAPLSSGRGDFGLTFRNDHRYYAYLYLE